MHSIIQSCLSEYTFPLEDEPLTQGKAVSSLQVTPVLNDFQIRGNRPVSWVDLNVIWAQKVWLTFRASLLACHWAQLHLQLSSQVLSIFPQHGSLKGSFSCMLCPALVPLRRRQLQRKTLFQDTELPFKIQHPQWATSAELTWLPNFC